MDGGCWRTQMRLWALLVATVWLSTAPQVCGVRTLLFARQEGTINGQLRHRLELEMPYDLDAAIFQIEGVKGKGEALFEVFRIDPDWPERRVVMYRRRLTSLMSPAVKTLRETEGQILGVLITGLKPKLRFTYALTVKRPLQGRIIPPRYNGLPAVCGLADLHSHQMADLAEGGNKYRAGHDGRVQPEALTLGFRTRIGHVQQMHETSLLQAHANGLNLLVVSASNWESNCEPQTANYSCADMDAVIRQVRAAKAFEARHSNFYEVAQDPWDARRIIHNGKMAVVLSVAVSDLFPDSRGAWKDQLAELYSMGVRMLQMVHMYNSRFAGAAPHRFRFSLNKWASMGYIFSKDKEGRNKLGLTDDGKELLREMKRLGMVLDVAHMGRNALRELDEWLDAEGLKLSVVHTQCFVEALLKEEDKHFLNEFSCDSWTLHFLRDRKGMVGLRLSPFDTQSYVPAVKSWKDLKPIPNNCAGSTPSVAQSLQHLYSKGLSVGFSSDFNGLTLLPGPRFGRYACPNPQPLNSPHKPRAGGALGKPKEPFDPVPLREKQMREQNASSMLFTDFDTKGPARVDLLPDLARDLLAVGADITPLEHSAEMFLRTWQIVYDKPAWVKPLYSGKAGRYMICEDYSPRKPAHFRTLNNWKVRQLTEEIQHKRDTEKNGGPANLQAAVDELMGKATPGEETALKVETDQKQPQRRRYQQDGALELSALPAYGMAAQLAADQHDQNEEQDTQRDAALRERLLGEGKKELSPQQQG